MPFLAPLFVAAAPVAVAAAPIVGAGVGVAQVIQAERARKAAGRLVGEQTREQMRLQEQSAGEYYELTEKQMELQTQESTIKTLAELMTTRTTTVQAPQVFTTAPVKEYSILDQINQAIGRLFG